MSQRIVIGLDSSTQSVKAIAWDAAGTPLAEGRAPHTILTPAPHHAEQDAAEWWEAAQLALRAVCAAVDPALVDGIAISNQRETMVLVDADGAPLGPATLWLDTRAREELPRLDAALGAEALHRITGKPLDVTPCVARLSHFRRTAPAMLDRAAALLSPHDFLVRALTGQAAASWTSADPWALYDIARKEWSAPILAHLGLTAAQLPPAHRPGTRLGVVTAEAAAATGLRAGAPVFAAGGDGQCAALGAGAIAPGAVYLNLGTAVVGGAWSAQPALSRYWRTLIAPTGDGYLLESVQRGGAFFVNWLIDRFGGGRADPAVFARLEAEAAALPVGAEGVTASTHFLGSMDPHWDESARGGFAGLAPEHGLGNLYRASLEAITLIFARALEAMRAEGVPTRAITAIGGGAASPLWVRMVADSTGLPVVRGVSNEASTLGAAISAAVGAGWFPGFAEAAAAMVRVSDRTEPDPAARPEWDALSARQARLYAALGSVTNPLTES